MRIVYFSVGMGSTIHGSTALAARLQADGHQVTIVSVASMEGACAAAGVDFVRLESFDQHRDRLRALTRARNEHRLSPAAWIRWLRACLALRRESLELRECRTLLVREAPDLVLADVEAHLGILLTLALDLPCALVSFFFDMRRHSTVPHLQSTLGLPTSLAERFRVAMSHRLLSLRSLWWRTTTRYSVTALRQRLAPIRYRSVEAGELIQLAKALELPLQPRIATDQWLRPWMYRDLPTMSLTLADLDFSVPPSHPIAQPRYVGPMLTNDRPEVRLSKEDVERLGSFISDEVDGAGRTLIYCGLGTYLSANPQVLSALVEVLRQRSDWALVVGLGGFESATSVLARCPQNVLFLNWAPQLQVLERAAVAVVHGGISSINECVATSTPMLFCLAGNIDSPGNVARLVQHGLGRRGRVDDSQKLLLDLEALINDHELAARLRQHAAALKAMVQEKRMEQFVNELCREHVSGLALA
ncbi:MAG: hypothetical protein AAF918_12010 [Pseudomonadota bacterium]